MGRAQYDSVGIAVSAINTFTAGAGCKKLDGDGGELIVVNECTILSGVSKTHPKIFG